MNFVTVKLTRATQVQIESQNDKAIAGNCVGDEAALPLHRESDPTNYTCGAAGKPIARSSQIFVPIGNHSPQHAV
ncbi:hypothetical protein D3C72_1995700 [compost metagenome]